jgi:RNA polymerase sigma-70 factor (ECF subfamily)
LAGNATSAGDQFGKAVELKDASILPEDVLEQVERTSVVRAAMLVLSEGHRKALIWKYLEGLSVDAIAARMERTAKAVESLLSRARQEMRALLREYIMPCGNVRRAGKESSDE